MNAVTHHNILPLGSACNLSCYFCSNRYNPPGLKTLSIPYLPLNLILDLICYLDPRRKIIIGESATRLNEGEPLFHPQFLAILKELRRNFPQTPIQITTNGTLLSPKIQMELASLNPIELVISFDSLKPEKRALYLGDSHPEDSLSYFYRLASSGIQFQASFVLAPSFLEEFPASLKIVEDIGAQYIRLLLPGGSKWAPKELQGSMGEWLELKERVFRWREKIGIPLMLEPPLVEDLKIKVEGIMKGSPARKSDLKVGDEILEINGKRPESRKEAFDWINQLENPELKILREEEHQKLVILKKRGEKSGLVFSNDLDLQVLRRLSKSIPEKGEGVCLTSELAYGIVSQAFQNYLPEVPVFKVPNLTFGGSIRSLGLLTFFDFQVFLSTLKGKKKFDWVILNPIFLEDGLDLKGQSARSLEEELPLGLIYS